MTSSSILGTMEPGESRASIINSPVAPPVVPARPEVAPIVPAWSAPTPAGAWAAPAAVAPSISPGEVEISIGLPGFALGFDHGKGPLANRGEPLRDRRCGRVARGTLGGGTRHS